MEVIETLTAQLDAVVAELRAALGAESQRRAAILAVLNGDVAATPAVRRSNGVRAGQTARRKRTVAQAATAVGTGREKWHGTTNGYAGHKCRCDKCRTAVREYHRAHRAKKRAAAGA